MSEIGKVCSRCNEPFDSPIRICVHCASELLETGDSNTLSRLREAVKEIEGGKNSLIKYGLSELPIIGIVLETLYRHIPEAFEDENS